jgi:hypothetical protein
MKPSQKNGALHNILMALLSLTILASGLAIGMVNERGVRAEESAGVNRGDRAEVKDRDAVADPIIEVDRFPRSFYDAAYNGAGTVPNSGARSAIVAHHLLVADKIAATFEAIADHDVRTVVVISPNHFAAGRSSAQVTRATWTTPYGTVSSDTALAEALAAEVGTVKIEDEAQEHEHGISGLMPFVARSFPNAKVLALVIHESLPDETVEQIAAALARLAPEATVVASIDMSHYLPAGTQSFHDEVTLLRIAGGAGVTGPPRPEIDANPVLDILLGINRARGEDVWHLTHHGSSISMGAVADWRENTSHILGYFVRGGADPSPYAALHFVGSLAKTADVSHRGTSTDLSDSQILDRFLSGTHLVIGNPFGKITVSDRANERMAHFDGNAADLPTSEQVVGGISLGLIGYDPTGGNETELTAAVGAADRQGKFVIVMPSWGESGCEAPGTGQRQLVAKLVDAGADLVVGDGNCSQGTEIIGDVPIIWSLGSAGLETNGLALTVGVIVEPSQLSVSVLPVGMKDGLPQPTDDTGGPGIIDTTTIPDTPIGRFTNFITIKYEKNQ